MFDKPTFAAEYNGEPYHPDDSEKIKRAEKRGWVYIKIFDKSEYSRNRRMLDERGRQFCQELYAKVQEIESEGNAVIVNTSA